MALLIPGQAGMDKCWVAEKSCLFMLRYVLKRLYVGKLWNEIINQAVQGNMFLRVEHIKLHWTPPTPHAMCAGHSLPARAHTDSYRGGITSSQHQAGHEQCSHWGSNGKGLCEAAEDSQSNEVQALTHHSLHDLRFLWIFGHLTVCKM